MRYISIQATRTSVKVNNVLCTLNGGLHRHVLSSLLKLWIILDFSSLSFSLSHPSLDYHPTPPHPRHPHTTHTHTTHTQSACLSLFLSNLMLQFNLWILSKCRLKRKFKETVATLKWHHALSVYVTYHKFSLVNIRRYPYTIYPKKYAHGFCFAVLCCGYILTDFPISIRLTLLALWQSNDCPSASKATLMNMDKYFMWIHYERLHNHNKAKHNKTVCIFLGIHCITHRPEQNGLHSADNIFECI